MPDPFRTLTPLTDGAFYYSLPKLEKALDLPLSKLPVSIRILLESLLRNCDERRVRQEDLLCLAQWSNPKMRGKEIPFVVSRVILQDFTGIPLLADLASMRDAAMEQGKDPAIIEPIVPVDLVIDHSVQVDRSGTQDAFLFNLEIEFQRNKERYEFLKWGQEAFDTFSVIPPGIGIVHQVNLEHLALVVSSQREKEHTLLYFDTVVGTDSHTTMIGGLGILGWGVGGIEAEAAMLGEPYFLPSPEVVGVHLKGSLPEGATATDLALYLTQLLRKEKVVGQFVEFFGEGASSLSIPDRATISNMAPEYGATIGFFPPDTKTLDYLALTGRTKKQIEQVRDYLIAQKLFGIPKEGEMEYSRVVTLDLKTLRPCVSGPKRPQDRIDLQDLPASFQKILSQPISEGGYGKKDPLSLKIHSDGTFHKQEPHITGGKPLLENNSSFSESEMVTNRPLTQGVINPGYTQHEDSTITLTHGSIAIAAITSCTNTSNPSVMLAAGLVAKKAVERGLSVPKHVKTSLAPGSRVVTDYLKKAGLQQALDTLGFQLVAYGCTTCIGNSGPLDERIEQAIREHDLIAVSVLSGNRNFEARVHGALKANFLMSPPLVVAFALSGRIDIDFEKEPIGYTPSGQPVFLRELLPTHQEVEKALQQALSSSLFQTRYSNLDVPLWSKIEGQQSATFAWQPDSTYIQRPPFFDAFTLHAPSLPALKDMRALAVFGDSVTTDHISPAGAFKANTPAGAYLIAKGLQEEGFNSYGSRRGNHHVMMRGTFANVRLNNRLASREGGFTTLLPDGEEMPIFDACQTYAKRQTPLILFAGKDYGMGSSRDWAAKGTALLGIRVVVAQSFERIHRSNLVGMGVLPLQFLEGTSFESLGLSGRELFSLDLVDLFPGQTLFLDVEGKRKIPLLSRLDTPIDVEYYKQGGILPYVLRRILKR